MEKMNGLDLFSGLGGISKALEPWVRTVAYCERDRYAQSLLLSRMATGELDHGPIHDDITKLGGDVLRRLGPIDVVFGGSPCQDLSSAGHGRGLAGERSGLFFEMARIIGECRPQFIFLENVPAIRTRGLHEVAKILSGLGFDLRWGTYSAKEIGAPHLRKRWFLLGRRRDVGNPQHF